MRKNLTDLIMNTASNSNRGTALKAGKKNKDFKYFEV